MILTYPIPPCPISNYPNSTPYPTPLGMAERALELMLTRVTHRVAFGAPLAEQGSIKEDIANARVDINQVRLLCLDTARKMDVQGNKNTKKEIALCKIAAPRMAKQVIDNAMQAFGGSVVVW